MTRNIRKQANQGTEGVDELFYNDRLTRDGLTVADYPARVDQAAIDLCYGISIGKSQKSGGGPLAGGGMVDSFDFGRATGEYYKDGLTALAASNSDLPRLLGEYDATKVGDLVFQLNQLRYKLEKERSRSDGARITDMNRVIEAVLEKVITRSLHAADDDVVRRSIEDPETVVDLMTQVFSDPASQAYATKLIDLVDTLSATDDILSVLDSPEMVTPLWNHQREAIETWVENDCRGYVDMATATGKTVLGLAAIATLFGTLHPSDEASVDRSSLSVDDDTKRVLIVAGQDLLLEQWRSEFDEHLNIPRDRTGATEGARTIQLDWGVIEFTSAQQLLADDQVGSYDLVILDEAHQYSKGRRSGRGWAAVLDELVEYSHGVLAMSGSVDKGWLGDEAVENTLTETLPLCKRFTVPEARDAGVIADFSWTTVYAGATGAASDSKLAETTATLRAAYDETTHKFDSRLVDSDLEGDVPEPFETLTDLRSFGQSKRGGTLRERSPAFDRLVTAAFSRRPQRWHLAPDPDVVAGLVAEHAPDRKVVVLVQSYKQAQAVGDALIDRIGEEFVLIPDAESENQFESVAEFNEDDFQVIIGPGKVLGTGVDMPEADVAVNVGKGGVNASLIQRMGRVLRNPSGDKQAEFYQVVTVPTDSNALIAGEDGRRLVRRAAEFRALGARLRELPGFRAVDADVERTVETLETAGVDAIEADHRGVEGLVGDEVAQRSLRDLIRGRRTEASGSLILSAWRNETLDRHSEPVREAVDEQSAMEEDHRSQEGDRGGREGDGQEVGSEQEMADDYGVGDDHEVGDGGGDYQEGSGDERDNGGETTETAAVSGSPKGQSTSVIGRVVSAVRGLL